MGQQEYAYVIYDFEIGGMLPDTLSFVRDDPPAGYRVNYPSAEGRSQGEIWRDIVQPELQAAARIVAYVDLPNANVAYEVGYSLGSSPHRKVALASHRRELPQWLRQPPFKGFYCKSLPRPSDLAAQIKSDSWFQMERRPERGRTTLLLCPEEGEAYFETIRRTHEWSRLPKEGWSFNDLPERLAGIGAVVWLILPHSDGPEARDGIENTALAVIAGYAAGLGLPIWILVHREARDVVDVMPNAFEFVGLEDLRKRLPAVAAEIEKAMPAAAPAVAVETRPLLERPHIAQAPPFDFRSSIEPRFIGREHILGDVNDAVQGLVTRWRGLATSGAADVQVAWCHGFGGMGKSWFVRRAVMSAAQIPDVRVALVDWDSDVWRAPLPQPPETPMDLFEPIAHRLSQLYDPAALDPFWEARSRIDSSARDRASLRQRFSEERGALRRGERPPDALRAALVTKELWPDDAARLDKVLTQLTMDRELEEAVFHAWIEAAGALVSDREAVLRPDDLRVTSLARCIRSVAARQPLVLALDTCELLSSQLDRWLRRLLTPLCDGRTPILILIASRLAPDVGEPPGSRHGWRSEVGNTRWRAIQFDEGVRFTVDEIEQSLKAMRRPIDHPETVAEHLHRVTLGVPLAVRSLIDLHEHEEDPVLSKLSLVEADWGDAKTPAEEVEEKVVELVTDRFLYHLDRRHDRRDDYEDIVLLALLNEADRDLLERVWNTENVRGRLARLAQRYSLVAVGDLHGTVRSFLRRRWRMEDRPAIVGEVAERLYGVVRDAPLPGAVGESDYMRALAIKLNAQSWAAPRDFFKHFAPALTLAIAFDEQAEPMLELGAEVAAALGQRALAKRFRNSLEELWPALDDELVTWLQGQHGGPNWLSAETEALNVLIGLRESRRGRHEEAFAKLAGAMAFFGVGQTPMMYEVGSALFDAGYELAKSKATEPVAMRAYKAAIDLDYAVADASNNLGLLHLSAQAFDLAEAAARRAMELDPDEPDYVLNLASVYRLRGDLVTYERLLREIVDRHPTHPKALNELGVLLMEQQRYDDAEDAFLRCIRADAPDPSDLEPPAALSRRNLGIMYQQQGRNDQAETWYREAIRFRPGYALAHADLGVVLRAQNRIEEAEAEYRQAIQLAPDDGDALNELAWLLYETKSEKLEEAEQLALRAAAVQPDDPSVLHTAASILLARRGWNGAADMLRRWVRTSRAEFVSDYRSFLLATLREIVALARVPDLLAMIDEVPDQGIWSPFVRALRAVASGDPSNLDEEARAILEELRPSSPAG